MYKSTILKQGQIKPDKILSYLLALKSYYFNWQLNLKGFNKPQMAFIIKGKRKLFLSKKCNYLPIIKNIFQKIIKDQALFIMDFNVITVFKLAWTGFMRIGELTYIAAKAKKATFVETSPMKSDISFEKGD